MIVHCIDFGSYWWEHMSTEPSGERGSHVVAFYNTTKVPKSPTGKPNTTSYDDKGVVRVNAKGFPWVTQPNQQQLGGRNAYSPGPNRLGKTTRLLLQCAVRRVTPPDVYLTVVRSDECGHVDFEKPWRTRGVSIISRSYNRRTQAQETMLLVPPDGAILTGNGIWKVRLFGNHRGSKRARLVLTPIEKEAVSLI